jgi:uncharacterized protein YjbI with pentapeptide repeats
MSHLERPTDNPAYEALRERQKAKFLDILADSYHIDFSNCYLRGVDLSEVSLSKVILKGAYLHSADLRGVDLSHHNLEGCSIHKARISGVFFPKNISVDEILMSLQHGTRIRLSSQDENSNTVD